MNIVQRMSMARALMVALLAVAGTPVASAQSSASAFTAGFRYDAARRLVGTISPSDGVTHQAIRNTYDSEGRLTRIEWGTLSQWQSEAVKPIDWVGFSVEEQTDRTYDLSGRLLMEWHSGVVSDARVTQYTYDDDGRLLCRAVRMNPASYSALPTSACTLGAEGDDGPDRITRYVYDAAGQVLNEQRAYGTDLQQNYSTAGYTANGKIDWIEDASGNRSGYAYDGFDRVWRLYLPQTTAGAHAANVNDYEQYAFDANGNRTSVRLRSGETIAYAFDALNRMSLKDLPTGDDVVYSYDLLGNRVFAKYGSALGYGVTYEADGFGQVLSTVSVSAAGALQLTYEYDADGNRTRVTWPDGEFIEYTYDGLNRVDQIRENGATSGAGLLIDYGYDALGRRTSVSRGNGTATSYAYDGISRLSSLAQDLASVGTDLTVGFVYNPAGQITQRAISNSSYDYVPSVQSKNYVSDGLNRYSSVGGVDYTYDGRGNLTSDGSRTFAYDLENHLLDVSGSGSLALTYDPLGRLWSTTSNSSTTRFLYDGDRLVAEYSGSTLLRRYVHGTGVDEPVVWYEGSGLTQRRWLHGDQQGSVIATSDGAGAGTVYAYGAFGEIGGSNWGGSRFRYTGQIVLPEAKLYHYKARIYDPSIGRFLQTDPIGYSDDFNLYAYVGNDPLNKTDPTGMYESHWLLRALVPGQVTFDNAMTSAESGNYGQAGALMGAMVGEQVLTVASFGAASAATPAVRTVETAAASASELNASRGLSARMGGIVFHGHHPIPKVLGGPSDQALETLTAGLHGKFHSMLGESLKKGGFDLPIGGKRGSAQAWSRYFSDNPGSQKRAQDIVRQTSKAFDKKYGTDLAGATKRMCTGSRIARETC